MFEYIGHCVETFTKVANQKMNLTFQPGDILDPRNYTFEIVEALLNTNKFRPGKKKKVKKIDETQEELTNDSTQGI